MQLFNFDTSVTRKGYTGHEQLDQSGLIHMNGRVYDPRLGRFIQADPIIQAPYDAQSLNRYSYVFNNPLANVDPTGFEMSRSSRSSGALCSQSPQSSQLRAGRAAWS